jgi:hypothetical protein
MHDFALWWHDCFGNCRLEENFSYMDDAHRAHWACEHPCVRLHLTQGHVAYASHKFSQILTILKIRCSAS